MSSLRFINRYTGQITTEHINSCACRSDKKRNNTDYINITDYKCDQLKALMEEIGLSEYSLEELLNSEEFVEID